MDVNHLFRVLINTIKAKYAAIVSKFRMWTSQDFIRAQLISKISSFFSTLLNIRPRHKKDYYEVLGWLVSRRLAFAVLLAAGVLSIYYLISINNVFAAVQTEGIRIYPYNSIQLRFASGKVRITGKSGYLAYEGDVDGGAVTGFGTLYNPQGVVVYQGDFVENRYQGTGVCYYDDGTMQYSGSFTGNQFDGSGKLYRENGSLLYEGEFSLGKREGQGTLYDTGSNPVYTGSFSQDELLYSELLGKTVSEVSQVYTGTRILYEGEEDFVVVLEDINTMYLGQDNSQTLDGEMTVEQITILKGSFLAGGDTCTAIEELRQYFGTANYEGNSDVTMSEAVAFDRLAAGSGGRTAGLDISLVYDDYIRVNGWDDTYVVYLYSFEKDGLYYTFVCEDRDAGFLFYTIERGEGGAV